MPTTTMRKFQTVLRQHHDGAFHPRYDMIGNLSAARCTVVNEDACFGRFEADRRLLAGIDFRHQRRPAQGAGRGVQIDCVAQLVVHRIAHRNSIL